MTKKTAETYGNMKEALNEVCRIIDFNCDVCPLLSKNGCPVDASIEVLRNSIDKENQ